MKVIPSLRNTRKENTIDIAPFQKVILEIKKDITEKFKISSLLNFYKSLKRRLALRSDIVDTKDFSKDLFYHFRSYL
ncbi:hypothetical protein DDW12_03675 [Sulfolobus islandicus]|nr:hypothetical protein DDW12_03675 [Sulfolobus islandicus]